MTAVLQLDDVQVKYGAIEALKGITLEVNEGEIVTLLGANGAGKTTTLRTISGLLRPTRGTVSFAGSRIDNVKSHEIVALGISQSPEGRRVFPSMTVLENLQMGAYQRRDNLTADLERVFGLFPILAERRKQQGGTLSGGEQQMLAIGRALMSSPKLLLLDEPSLGLAPLIVKKIFEIIQEINEQGTTVLLVEQNAVQALKLAHRGYVLETGNIVMGASAAELLADPRVRAAYLGEDVA
ncbi:MAG: branched-chain amino acid transport system ATP-binding protein [Frankiaceae bacterium]|jgi:branched-chain amino acid transport system ATP-binding protein|nr:branched-chain amino acid transport system ATP-binding protein [Frankiaceae bacterium]MDX6225448.1 branched-chain amino acid transport system ATP-binding protein [Frankiales bacterium]MDX6274063.1 branched-chain amino acid transport system ATP-binding protein [Frankiales bacterium]